MTAALWLGTYLLHSTVLCGILLLFRRHLRRVDGAEHVWRAAMLLPLVSATMTQLPRMGVWAVTVPAEPLAMDRVVGAGPDVAAIVAGLCLATGATLVVRDWIAYRRFVVGLGPRRLVGTGVTSQVADLLAHAGVRQPIRLTQAHGATSPVVLSRNEICLPDRVVRDLPLAQLRGIVAHEVAHVVRGDARWFLVVAWLESALFVQPLNRMVRGELRFLAEMSCDDWAAQRTADRMAVASCLVEVAGWLRQPSPVAVPAAMSARLTERVQRLLDPPTSLGRVSRAQCLVAVTVAALALPGVAVSAGQALAEPTTSADYLRGFDLGRRDAALNGLGPPADLAAAASTRQQRADLERQLQAKRAAR